MTNNTAAPARNALTHANCSHPVTKVDRARCRRERGAAYNNALAARRTASNPSLVIEPCSDNGPTVDGICTLCDRPALQLAAA